MRIRPATRLRRHWSWASWCALSLAFRYLEVRIIRPPMTPYLSLSLTSTSHGSDTVSRSHASVDWLVRDSAVLAPIRSSMGSRMGGVQDVGLLFVAESRRHDTRDNREHDTMSLGWSIRQVAREEQRHGECFALPGSGSIGAALQCILRQRFVATGGKGFQFNLQFVECHAVLSLVSGDGERKGDDHSVSSGDQWPNSSVLRSDGFVNIE